MRDHGPEGAGVGVGLGAAVGAGVGVGAGAAVAVGTAVGAGAAVAVGTAVGEGAAVAVGTAVGEGAAVAVGTAVGAGAAVAVGTAVGEGAVVAVGTAVGEGAVVAVGTGVRVDSCPSGTGEGSAASGVDSIDVGSSVAQASREMDIRETMNSRRKDFALSMSLQAIFAGWSKTRLQREGRRRARSRSSGGNSRTGLLAIEDGRSARTPNLHGARRHEPIPRDTYRFFALQSIVIIACR